MPQFDQERMVKLVSHLRTSVARLQELSSLPKDQFLNDSDKIGSSKYYFIVAIESCIDMANHIISQNGYRAPEDYSDTFTVMEEAGAIEKEFSNVLGQMAKFRNRLVHLYWEVDDTLVFEYLRTHLGDFKRFLNALSIFLEWNQPNPS